MANKTNEDMTTTSIYINKELLNRLKFAAGQAGVSLVLSKLGEKWLKDEIDISLRPITEKIDA